MTAATHLSADTYMPHLYEFLMQVAANNNRPWFQEHRAIYDELRTLWLADLDRLIALITQWEPEMASQTARTATYRFNRDTRFSTDKSPYKTFFSAAFCIYGRKADRAGYYLQIGTSRDEGLYGGIWMPEAPVLKKLRRAVVDNYEELEEILARPQMRRWWPEWCTGGSLKTVPKGWDRNHPLAHLLRLRQYGRECAVDRKFFCSPDWVERTAERFHALKPLIDFLNYSIDEEEPFTLDNI